MAANAVATTNTATFDQLFAYHDQHKSWPTTSDPHFGLLVRHVNDQYKRLNNGQSPHYGSKYGFTQEVHSKLRRYKYAPAAGGRTARATGLVGQAEATLERGEKLANSLASTIRAMAGRGSLSPRTVERFKQLGFTF